MREQRSGTRSGCRKTRLASKGSNPRPAAANASMVPTLTPSFHQQFWLGKTRSTLRRLPSTTYHRSFGSISGSLTSSESVSRFAASGCAQAASQHTRRKEVDYQKIGHRALITALMLFGSQHTELGLGLGVREGGEGCQWRLKVGETAQCAFTR